MNTSLASLQNLTPLFDQGMFYHPLNRTNEPLKTTFSLVQSDATPLVEMNVHRPRTQNRNTVEGFIKDIFFNHHKAKLKVFMPMLLSTQDHAGKITSAVGIRHISKQAIFLEQYLSHPIEQMISSLTSTNVRRNNIAEVGNLACSSSSHSKNIIILLVHQFFNENIDWAVCTGTTMVQIILKRLGIEFQYIDRAEPDNLQEDKDSWGTYYENNPCVLAIDIKKAIKVLDSKFHLDYVSK
ncbi:MAG: thermostable hemolysin [Thalassotalea sp.]|nr:thermostable hemolysin [Thalassotalea sp.]MDG2393731.1 thermostable hemolysin [Thalassotalea sp.]